MSDVVHAEDSSRFEVTEDGRTAVLTYERTDDGVAFLHTVVPEELGGRGIGGRLAAAGVGWAVEQGLEVTPVCTFVQGWLEKHPEALRVE